MSAVEPITIGWCDKNATNLCNLLDCLPEKSIEEIYNFAKQFSPDYFRDDNESEMPKNPTDRILFYLNKMFLPRSKRINVLTDESLPEYVRVKAASTINIPSRGSVMNTRSLIAVSAIMEISPWWVLGLRRVPFLAKNTSRDK